MVAISEKSISHRAKDVDKRTPPLELLQQATPENMFKRRETIPIRDIDMTEAITSPNHATVLAKDIMKTGQNTPIVVRARLSEADEGQPQTIVYDVIDGFNRTAGLKDDDDHEKKIEAIVFYGMSDEEMYHQRLLAINSINSVRLARIALWVTKAYEFNSFAEQVNVADAFRYGSKAQRKTEIKGVTAKEKRDLLEWVDSTSEHWGKSPEDMHTILKLVKHADPEIVKRVRLSDGRKREPDSITRGDLEMIVKYFPGEDNFTIQNAIARFLETNHLTKSELSILLKNLSNQQLPKDSTSSDILSGLKDVYHSSSTITIPENTAVFTMDVFIPNDQERFVKREEPVEERRELITGGDDVPTKLLEERVKTLEEALKKSEGQLKEAVWWEAVPLTPLEKRLVIANAQLELAQYIQTHQINPDEARRALRIAKGKKDNYFSKLKYQRRGGKE